MIPKWGKRGLSLTIWTLTVITCWQKQMIYTKKLLEIFKNGFIHGIMMKEEEKDHYLHKKSKTKR